MKKAHSDTDCTANIELAKHSAQHQHSHGYSTHKPRLEAKPTFTGRLGYSQKEVPDSSLAESERAQAGQINTRNVKSKQSRCHSRDKTKASSRAAAWRGGRERAQLNAGWRMIDNLD